MKHDTNAVPSTPAARIIHEADHCDVHRILMKNSPEGVFAIDPEMRIILWSPGMQRLTGMPEERVLGRPALDVFPFLAETGEDRNIRAALGGGTVTVSDRPYNIPETGRRGHFEGYYTPLMERGGEVFGAMAVLRDVSDRKATEEALRQTNRELEQALTRLRDAQQQLIRQERLRALGEMAGGIAHDFNNALAAIMGFADLLLRRPENLGDPEKVRSYAEYIRTAAGDAGRTVSRLREFYRARRGDEPVERVDLAKLCREVASLTEPRWKEDARGQDVAIDVRCECDPVPPIPGVAAELREALTNLVLNALDAMPEGGTITLSCRARGEHAIVSVRDTGTGMSEEVRRRCFEPFFTTKGDRGTGLGLAEVYGILQRHNGSVDVESALGHGTLFTLRLPLDGGSRSAPPQPAPAAPARKLRILVAEDDRLVRMAVVEHLRGDGHAVDEAANGIEAMEKLAGGPYDLVVADRAMPAMGGERLARSVKARWPRLPLVMLTGYADIMRAQGEMPEGVDVLAAKPASLEDLRRAVARATGAAASGTRERESAGSSHTEWG